MSVHKSKRGQSSMQYVQTAFDIYKEAMRLAVKIPKRYTFYISQDIVRTASDIFSFCKSANSIYSNRAKDNVYNQHEVTLRRDALIQAKCKCQVLISQIEIARQVRQRGFPFLIHSFYRDAPSCVSFLLFFPKHKQKKSRRKASA